MSSAETIPTSCAEAAVYYTQELGFSVIPVGVSKRPLVEWREYQSRIATAEEIASWWKRYPCANLAIVTGTVSNIIAIDIDSESGLEWVKTNFPNTGVYGKTSRGWHALYRSPGVPVQNAQKLVSGIDIRGDGGYIVAYPSVHKSGHQYSWVYTPGLDGWSDLHEYPNVALRALNQQHGSCVSPADGSFASQTETALCKSPPDAAGRRRPWTGDNTDRTSGVYADSIEQYIEIWRGVCSFMRYYIDNQAEQTEEIWFSMLTNIVRSKDFPLHIAHTASNRYPKYSRAETDKKYLHALSMKGPRTCEQIKKYNKCGGCPGYGSPVNSYERSPVADNIIIETISSAPSNEIPPALLNPGGILSDIMDYIHNSTVQSFPLWDLGAALCLLGTAAGQRINSGLNGVTTNLYIVVIGNSGTGKSSGMHAVERLLETAGLTNLKGASTFTSGSALLKSLIKRPVQLMLVDEIGDILKRMKNPNSYAADLFSLLKDLHSKTNNCIQKDFAGSDSYIVKYPHLSFYGATTPERFWKAVDSGDAEDGFLARVITLESRHLIQSARRVKTKTAPEELIKKLQDISRLPQTQGSGNMDYVPRPIQFSTDAADKIAAVTEHYINLANYNKDENSGSVYLRAAELTERLALIYALSQKGAALECVELDAVEWADTFVTYYTTAVIYNMQSNMNRGGEHELLQKVYNIIIRHRDPDGYITFRKLAQMSHMLSKTLKPVLETLLDSEKLTEREITARNGKKIKYYAVLKET
ncbi:MAG: bifunctional DNA primase/polymerase [Deferribacteraceae bacterium]|jgi:hypothetical protein|nr:bifunctional DNA primase/polymerase [Deferribacteraceae bacterium]